MIWLILALLSGGAAAGAAAALARHAIVHGWRAAFALVVRLLRGLVRPVPVLGPLTAAHKGRHSASWRKAYEAAGTTQRIDLEELGLGRKAAA